MVSEGVCSIGSGGVGRHEVLMQGLEGCRRELR